MPVSSQANLGYTVSPCPRKPKQKTGKRNKMGKKYTVKERRDRGGKENLPELSEARHPAIDLGHASTFVPSFPDQLH